MPAAAASTTRRSTLPDMSAVGTPSSVAFVISSGCFWSGEVNNQTNHGEIEIVPVGGLENCEVQHMQGGLVKATYDGGSSYVTWRLES